MKIEITCDREHASALVSALEIVARAGMGQFRNLADLFEPPDSDGSSMCDRGIKMESLAKDLLIPELAGTGACYGMRHSKTPRTCKLAWELYEAMLDRDNRTTGLTDLPLPIVIKSGCSEEAGTSQPHFGERLRAARIKAGLSQTELAKQSKIPQPHLSRLERGTHEPKTITVWKLAESLKTTPADLIGKEGVSQSFEQKGIANVREQ